MIRLGHARDASGEPLDVAVIDDEELIEAGAFEKAVYPVEIGASQTFYPDADPETSSVDGALQQNNDPDTWANIRGGPGTLANDTNVDANVKIKCSATTDRYKYYNWYAALFDTSGLPDDALISAAILSLFGFSKQNDQSINFDVNIYASNPASNTALEAGDYDARSYTPFATAIDWDDWITDGYNDFPFNAAGRSSISKTGVSKYALLEVNYDVGGATPFWATADQGNYDVRHYTADQGSGYKPKLVVTYIVTPTVNTDPATSVASRAAVVNATLVDDGGEVCDCCFEWGETVGYGNTTPIQEKGGF